MKKAKDALSEASHKLAEAIYKEAANKGQPGSGPAGNANAAGTNGHGHGEGQGSQPNAEAVDAEVVDEGKK
jgi:hypothetical protein